MVHASSGTSARGAVVVVVVSATGLVVRVVDVVAIGAAVVAGAAVVVGAAAVEHAERRTARSMEALRMVGRLGGVGGA